MGKLEEALRYHRLGWCIIPIRPGTKRPACRSWKQYQTDRPDEAALRRWFGNDKPKSLAVILGEVSGGLVCRDFDCMASYERWAAKHPDLARTLPTVETGRPGRHVYLRADIGQIRAESPSGGSIIDLGDGELRGGGYCLVPRSKHPSGHIYRWLTALADEVPFVSDLRAAGLLCGFHATESNREQQRATESNGDNGEQQRATESNGDNGDNRRQLRITEVIVDSSCGVAEKWLQITEGLDEAPLWNEDVQRAILESLPCGPGRRNKQVFELARALKAIPALRDAPGKHLEPYVRIWHELAKRVIRTEPFEESWIDFLRGWPTVKFPKGVEPMSQIFAEAVSAEVPRVAMRYEQGQLRLLVALCRELQRVAGTGPFYLSCRTAGRLLGIDHTTAWRWLFLLEHDDVIRTVSKGSQSSRKASRYRYLPDV